MPRRTAPNVTQSLPNWRGVAGDAAPALGDEARAGDERRSDENPHIDERMTRAAASAHPTSPWRNPVITGEEPFLVTQPLPGAVVDRQL